MSESEILPKNAVIRVLIVDDSAFVRKVVREMLTRSPFIEVIGIANDGVEALRKVVDLKPDVITCDLTMPRMGGVEFVRQQMEQRPVPILILSASASDAEAVVEAMSAGAVDFLKKPSALATDELLHIREDLVSKVKAAALVPVQNLRIKAGIEPPSISVPRQVNVDAVVLGVSTGGPQALRYLLPQLPVDFPVPLLIVLHMPIGYTAMFASKLDELCKIKVREAQEGQLLSPGLAIIAQGGLHMALERNAAGRVVVRLPIKPEKTHRPSVDVLFQSAAAIFKSRLLAIVMTGMGDDGKEGAGWIKAEGGRVLTESENSCVIYGMPRCVDEAGLSDASVPLSGMAEAIMKNL